MGAGMAQYRQAANNDWGAVHCRSNRPTRRRMSGSDTQDRQTDLLTNGKVGNIYGLAQTEAQAMPHTVPWRAGERI